MAKTYYYYQQIDNIDKEVALVKSAKKITDTAHYREVDKDYYDAVLQLLREMAEEAEKEEQGE